ncbi:MAG: methyltransferase domain-containing protein [Candidatus Uhrbacteria bacterium]|nr:methyltransferase domain-containing protein [Candidatus Uhrbacteria bacterium]
MKHFLLAGIHPELTEAEAEAVLGTRPEHRLGSLLIMDSPVWDGSILQERLAGTVKLGDILFEMTDTPELTELAARIADEIDARPRGDRVLFGLTVFGSSKEKNALKKLPIELKRALQDRDRSVRWVTGDKGEISPAAVAKLKLTTEGYDFVIGVEKNRVIVGLTTHVQNADAWSLRDYGRPFRDAKTGMLPPKLARMMVNLATGDGLSVMGVGHNPKPNTYRLLDPFCGGGTALMEAALMLPSTTLVGSDIDAKQVEGSKRNFEWLVEQHLLSKERVGDIRLLVSPAQEIGKHVHEPFDAIVTEGYLGEPLHGQEPKAFLLENKESVERVWEESLPVLSGLMKPGARLVCVWPEYRSAQGSIKTDARSAAESAGLKIVRDDLRYARPDQHLVRRIVILAKKG